MAGVTLNNRKLAADVREKTLKEIQRILDSKDPEDAAYKKELVIKLAASVLPRLNEHTGEDGEKLTINVIKYGGNNDTLPISTEGISTTVSTSSSEV